MDKDFYHSLAFHQILRDSIEYRCIRRIFNAGYQEGVRDAERCSLDERSQPGPGQID
jgi:hypothetical protein